jgi:DNA-binding transcriptional MerR regulator
MTGIQVLPDLQYQQMQQQQSLPVGAVSQSEFDQAIQVLKSDKLRGFKVDIETDSTIPVDRMQDQQNRIAFIQAVGQYLTGIIPAVQEGAIPMKVAREGLLFVVRGFKIGTELEEVLEELGQDGEQAQQMAQLQKMVPALQEQIKELQQQLQEAQQKGQADAARAQADIVVSNTQAQNDITADNVKTANTIAIDRAKAGHSMAVATHTAMNRPPPKQNGVQ